jgi:hypothetical protein
MNFLALTSTSPPVKHEKEMDALYYVGHKLLADGRPVDAAVVFRAMLMTSAGDERAWVGLGACHEALDQLDLAREMYGTGRVLAKPAGRCEIGLLRLARSAGDGDLVASCLDRASDIAAETEDPELAQLVRYERQVTTCRR